MQRNNPSEAELEGELEGEFAHELEGEGELEGELFGAGEGEFEGEGELEGEGEMEGEGEFAHEMEGENENELLFGEGEFAHELEGEFAHEHGFGEGEQFFGKALRGVGRFVKKNAGVFKAIGRIAAPLVAKTVGGLVGGPAGAMLGSKLGNFVASQLKEMEGEMELNGEGELGGHHELEGEGEMESHEAPAVGQHEAISELFAQQAAQASNEAEAEAMIGAAVTTTLTLRQRAALRRVLKDLVRGAAILTRILRLRRSTRPPVRLLPDIMRLTSRSLVRAAASGRPLTPQTAGRIMAMHTRRVFGSPRYAASAMQRSIQRARLFTRAVGTPSYRPSFRRY